MKTLSRMHSGIAFVVCALMAIVPATAEDVEKKLRLGVSIGGYDGADNDHSPSANVRTVVTPDDIFLFQISDPRNDSAAISDFGLEPQWMGTFSASYAFTPNWYVEGSVGYRLGDVGNVEVQAQFFGQPPVGLQPFAFRIFNLDGGTLTQVPLQVTGGYRFRPKAALNPYVCLGFGYTFNSFSPSDDLNSLSRQLDNSVAGFAPLAGSGFLAPANFSELSAIRIEAPDAAEWHLGGGMEISFKRRWVVFLDARYLVYSGEFAMHVNGESTQLGVSVPADQIRSNAAGVGGPFGPYLVPVGGGLIDGGSLIPAFGAPPDVNCSVEPGACTFQGPKDGIPDPGYYYVHGGSVRYDGVTFQVGVKFTF